MPRCLAARGTDTVTRTVTDGAGNAPSASAPVPGAAVAVQPDSTAPGKYQLAVGGTTADDTIIVKQDYPGSC